MARPKKEGLDYFPHDVDSVNDEKVEALRMLYKNDGYAFYFILLERIYRTNNFELDISDAETIQILSQKIGINETVFNQILNTALKRGCFDREVYEERQCLTSNGIKKRAGIVTEKRLKMQEAYINKKIIVSDAGTPQETIPETPQSKVNKSIALKDIEGFFDSVWVTYPKKEGKGQVSRTQKEKLYKIGYDKIKKCVTSYTKAKAGTEKKFLQNGSTFFNSGYVDYLEEGPTQEVPALKPVKIIKREEYEYEHTQRT